LAAFERPPKTPDNSSLPPSKGQKSDRPVGDKPPRKSRPGFGRALEPNPDRTVDARLDSCPHCAAAFPAEQQTPQRVYDRGTVQTSGDHAAWAKSGSALAVRSNRCPNPAPSVPL
jgi:hypothetical protein